jgi:pyruvate dehydrogenase E2 component (dihydrolipoamide acetyltransferase)
MASEAASSPPASAQQQPPEPAPPAQSPPPPASAPQPQETRPEIPKGDRIFASPIAKKIALEKGIPLAKIKGTGPDGRIIRDDVERYQPPVPSASTALPDASSDYTDTPVSNMRKVIGARLTQSKQELPHYYLTVEVNMDKVLTLRQVFNKTLGDKDKAAKLSVNDFVLKAVACALKDVPEANSAWLGDVIRQYVSRSRIFSSNLPSRRYKNADISVAVATPTGLITPIVKNVGSKGLATISAEAKALATKARDGKLAPQEYQVSISFLFLFTRFLIHLIGRDFHCVQSWHV